MKKVFSIVSIVLAFTFILSSDLFAQKKFRGTVTLQLSYTGDVDAATIAQLPKTKTLLVYDNKTKEQTNYGPVLIEQITDGDNKTFVLLIDQMGDKKYLKLTKEELDKINAEGKKDVQITYSDETKTIAGYTCKKATATYKDKDDNTVSIVVYYSEELGNESMNFNGEFKGLKGLPMEYEITEGDMKIKVTATEVKKGKVKDTDMMIPADYVEYTAEEKQQVMQMLMGGGEE